MAEQADVAEQPEVRENPSENTETPVGTGDGCQHTGTGATDGDAADTKFKQHARTWEKRAKESNNRLAALEEQLAEIQQARDAAVAERDQMLAEKASMEETLTRYKIGREAGLPDLLCERLQGDTPDAIREDAERVAKLLGRAPVNLSELSGGFDPNTPAPIDPVKIVDNMPSF